ncbi:regulator of G-protein signaling 22-like isoform X2 [Oscarella lobularis]|uniref:regulator of G-protein signaling 22-like isoform X2 n=1 Tax=Oscarella lobularis TaxID=121494 RepID=UPI003313E065
MGFFSRFFFCLRSVFFFGSLLACGVVFARGAVLVVPGNALCFDCVNTSTLRCEMERVCSTAFGAVRLSALDRHVHGIVFDDATNFDEWIADPIAADFFNFYLGLPVFLKSMHYDSKSQCIELTEAEASAVDDDDSADDRRRRIASWAEEERLPYFARSLIYCKYKLCRCLIFEEEEPFVAPPPSSSPRKSFPGRSVSASAPKSKPYSARFSCRSMTAEPGARFRPFLESDVVDAMTSYFDVDDSIDNYDDDDDDDDDVSIDDVDVDDDAKTEADVRDLESRRRKTYDEIRREVVGSSDGVDGFGEFLIGSVGRQMMDMWLDVESMKARKESNVGKIMRYLFDTYGASLLGSRARRWLCSPLMQEDPGIDPLKSVQRRLLLRLRSYWCPRYVLHREAGGSQLPGNFARLYDDSDLTSRSLPASFPETTLGVDLGEELSPLSQRIRSARIGYVDDRPTYSDFVSGMTEDGNAGGPFAAYLERKDETLLGNVLAFWHSCVAAFKRNSRSSYVRFISSKIGWSLWYTYVSDDAERPIGVDDDVKKSLKKELDESKGAISVKAFRPIERYAVLVLKHPWSEYLKEDYDTYIKARTKPKIEPPPSASSESVPRSAQLKVPSWGSGFKSKGRRRRRKKRFSRDNSTAVSSPKDSAQPEARKLVFAEVVANKKVVSAFKEYLCDLGDYATLNRLLLWMDIQSFKKLSSETGRASFATSAHKTYFYEKSRRSIDLPALLRTKVNVKASNYRPPSDTLLSVQSHLYGEIEILFQGFLQTMLQTLHPDEAETRCPNTDDLAAITILCDTKIRRRKPKQTTGKATPLPEHRSELEALLASLDDGVWPERIDSFRAYLHRHGESDGVPLAENDLLFWIEVQRFKYLCHGFADKSLIRRKAEVLGDCFLDSQSPPWLQVDIPSDLSQRLLHTIHNQLYFPSRHANRQAKDLVAFDEAQSIVVRHLLPFWAGFAKQYRPSTSTLGVVAGRRRKQMTNKIVTKGIPTRRRLGGSGTKPSIVKLPPLPETRSPENTTRSLHFSLGGGVKWKSIIVNDAVGK